jgi:hypothetical protein
LRDKMEDIRIDIGMDSMMLMVVPMFPLAYLQIHSLISGRAVPLWVVIAVTVPTLVFVALHIRKLLARSGEMDKLRLGLDAELAVGQELDQLMRDGAHVFHDMPADRFNIDHVVVSRRGVFAVETKGYTKPNRNGGLADAKAVFDGKSLSLPDRTGTWAIEQAQRQARWLSAWLASSTGEPIAVTPVLALPGWFVERTGRGEVLVFSGKELQGALLKARTPQALTDEQVQRVVHQVERVCRDVEPNYRLEDRAT